MSHVNAETCKWLRNVLRPEYLHADRTFDDVVETLSELRSLRPKTDIYTDQHGQVKLLLLLHGTVAIIFEKIPYKIPLHVWIPHNYPSGPPLAFVVPVSGMGLRPGNFVDINRRCYHPYLANWTSDPEHSRLVEAIRCLQYVFSKSPPVYALPPSGNMTLGSEPPHRPPVPAKVELVSNASSRLIQQDRMTTTTTPEIRKLVTPAADRHETRLTDSSRPRHKFEDVPGRLQIDFLSADRDEVRDVSELPRRPTNPQMYEVIRQIQDRLRAISDGEHQRFLQQIRREDEVTRDLRARGAALSSEMHTLTRLVHVSGNNAKILQDKIAQAKQLIDETKQEGVPEVDQCLVAQNVVYNQLYDAVTQELAIEDTIYALGKALETERLSMDDFLKHIKILAREQFMQRALVHKITTLLALE